MVDSLRESLVFQVDNYGFARASASSTYRRRFWFDPNNTAKVSRSTTIHANTVDFAIS